MNEITIMNSNVQTMTSREIAELVESRHDKVKQSIERLVTRGVISQPPMGDGIKSANGVTEKHYLISKRDSYVIVAQLSPEFTARLVDRWQALEQAIKPRVVKDSKLAAIIEMSYKLDETQELAKLAQDTADRANKLAQKHDFIIANNKSREVLPDAGYYSIRVLQNKLADVFPKAHTQGITQDDLTRVKIRKMECSKYVEATLSYETFTAYNLADCKQVIKDLIATGSVILGSNGEPTQKIKSPLYGQSFKHPM